MKNWNPYEGEWKVLNIVVVFPKKEIVLKMKNVLIKNGFDVSAVCVTGAQAIQAVERLEAGVVVCGIRFADMIYNELKECIPDTFEMVVIASNAQWQEYGDDDVIYLPLPLKAYDLVDTVSDLLTDIHRRLKREREKPNKRSSADQGVINQAKSLLMEKNGLTEEEAHRYLQKRSMDNGTVIHYQRDLDTLTAKDFIDVVRLHAENGVDFVTLHCGITRKTIDQIKKHKRKMNIVSRGGSLVFAWMTMTGEENPFYEYFDEILDICQEYDVTISLGDACRPGCLADGSDVCQIEELVRLGELTKRAWEKNVQVMVEGPGHMPMDQIAANMKLQSTICSGAPFYVLGPIVTDIAPGYDHIVSAIGGAIAAQNGAAFLCYVTPAEHLALPNLEDVKQGIMASKIAAHAADIAKGVRGAREIDDKMADARRVLDWEAQWECAMDPETAKAIRDDRKPEHEDTCSMCGKFCAVRSMNKALAGEHIDIL